MNFLIGTPYPVPPLHSNHVFSLRGQVDPFNNINQIVVLSAVNPIDLPTMHRIQAPSHSLWALHGLAPHPLLFPHSLFSLLASFLVHKLIRLFPASGPSCVLFPHLECVFSFSLQDSFLLIELNGISPLGLFKRASSVMALVFNRIYHNWHSFQCLFPCLLTASLYTRQSPPWVQEAYYLVYSCI